MIEGKSEGCPHPGPPPPSGGGDFIHQTAAEWLTRLQDRNVSLEDTLEWQRWIKADAQHAAAFARIEAVWEEPWEILQKKSRTRGHGGLRWAIAAGTAVVALLLGWTAWRSFPTQTLRTQVGETRSVLLADGSRVVLGGDTQLKISLDTLQRHLNLTRGEALFNVVKDAARPFTVYAGNTTVTAIGTEFNVRRSRDRIVVAVVEGRVTVAPEHEQKPVQLDAGQQTIVDRKGVKSTVKLLDAAAATAWQSGRLVFRGEPLRYVLEDVNRYSLKPIVLQDERIGDIRITGTVLGGSVEGWIASLENAFALKAVEGRDEIVLSKAR